MFFTTEPNGVYTETEFYVKDKNVSSIYSFCTANGGTSANFSTFTLGQHFDVSNNAFKIKDFPSSYVGKIMYYMACK